MMRLRVNNYLKIIKHFKKHYFRFNVYLVEIESNKMILKEYYKAIYHSKSKIKALLDYYTEYYIARLTLLTGNLVSFDERHITPTNYIVTKKNILMEYIHPHPINKELLSLDYVIDLAYFNFNFNLFIKFNKDPLLKFKSSIFSVKRGLIRRINTLISNQKIDKFTNLLNISIKYNNLPEIECILHKDLSYNENHVIDNLGLLKVFDFSSSIIEKRLFMLDIVAISFNQELSILYSEPINKYFSYVMENFLDKSNNINADLLFASQVSISLFYLFISYENKVSEIERSKLQFFDIILSNNSSYFFDFWLNRKQYYITVK